MHAETGGTLKGTCLRKLAPYPQDGTRRRELYDVFKANEGIPIRVKLNHDRGDHTAITALRDTYGLDIRLLRRGPGATWVLAGEWFGSEYVDYIAQRIKQHEASQGGIA
jgi:hypothetical protein